MNRLAVLIVEDEPEVRDALARDLDALTDTLRIETADDDREVDSVHQPADSDQNEHEPGHGPDPATGALQEIRTQPLPGMPGRVAVARSMEDGAVLHFPPLTRVTSLV